MGFHSVKGFCFNYCYCKLDFVSITSGSHEASLINREVGKTAVQIMVSFQPVMKAFSLFLASESLGDNQVR